MKFCEYIYNRLNQMNYDYVFGLPGYYIMPIWQMFEKSPKMVLSRHESGAVFMADGWSRITKKPGVVLGTIGPGQTNMMTGVACAYKDSVPLLVITGQGNVDSFGKGIFQECYPLDRGFSPTDIFNPITKASIEITDIRNAVFLFERAYRISLSGRPGPVHLSIPFEIQEAELPESSLYLNKDKLLEYNENVLCGNMSEALEDIKKSEKTLIFAGWGCYLSESMSELKTLSEKLSAPIITTIKGLSAISYDWDYFIGHIGNGQRDGIIKFISDYNPDTVLVLGSSMSDYEVSLINDILDKAKCIQVDISPEQLGLHREIDLGIQSDLKVWIKEVNKLLTPKKSGEIKEKIASFKNMSVLKQCEKAEDNDKFSFMAKAISELNKVLPKNAVVIPDAGNHWLDTLSMYNTKSVNGFFTNSGLGSMGHAIGCAIGMKLAMPDKRLVCITGDGSALMFGNEISVSARLKLDNIFIVFNNSSLGRVRTHQYFSYDRKYIESDIDNINISKWAEGLGAVSFRAETIDQFVKSVKEAIELKGTSVIEAVISNDEVPVALKDNYSR
ncbi:MAG: thiamine pyrophosphate-binding protein [Clostridium sp.]|nr:thiamine pyrophosphate-binding protein [Clostridium sp.]